MKVEKATLERVIRSTDGPPAPAWPHRPASVSLLLFGEDTTQILAILKADHHGYVWRNQIALPGGRTDNDDPDAFHTAIRELKEELNISSENVEYVGSLGHFQTLQNTVIEVFVGIWNERDAIRFEDREIAKVLRIPLETIIETHIDKQLNGRMPAMEELLYPVEDMVIWGVTAKILHFFIERLYPELDISPDRLPAGM
jgi:8-oxo-dGTP pyrophosphatase MutT (NUDIX family)